MVYLNDTEADGTTHFPDIEVKVAPRQGRVVIWNNLTSEGLPNPYAKHHGMPVEKGYKTVITKWFREKPRPPKDSKR